MAASNEGIGTTATSTKQDAAAAAAAAAEKGILNGDEQGKSVGALHADPPSEVVPK